MTFAPRTLRDLEAFWVQSGGRSLGIVGSPSHTGGYHLGRDRLYDGPGPGQGDRDYSVQTARDKAGLSDAASAIDLGRLNGSLPALYRFSRWLVEQCRANAPGTRDIREIIYSPDGERVLRWDRQRGYASAPIAGEGDDSHLTHSHVAYYRDAQDRDKRPAFAPYFAAPLPPEDDMPVVSTYIPGQIARIMDATGPANIRSAPSLTAPLVRSIPKGAAESWTVTGWVKGETLAGSDQWITRWDAGKWEYTHRVNVQLVAPPVADCTAAVKAATDPLVARIDAIKAKVAANAADIADD
jgi:hypothetical protein